jgi:hypothetical protein
MAKFAANLSSSVVSPLSSQAGLGESQMKCIIDAQNINVPATRMRRGHD